MCAILHKNIDIITTKNHLSTRLSDAGDGYKIISSSWNVYNMIEGDCALLKVCDGLSTNALDEST